ncbi:acetyl-CoA synthetase, partial [mine drainage metagenome]
MRDRVNDAEAKVVITCDEGWRNGGRVELKNFADKAVEECPSVEKMVVVQRTGGDVSMIEGRDIYYHDLIDGKSKERPATITDSEDMLFVLYTSGTTARPKGIVHTTGGYLVGAATTHRLVFDIKPDDIYFCTADIGWVTGHTYIVYGP